MGCGEPVMKVTKITDGLHQIAVGPVHVFLVEGRDGLVLVDTGLPGSAEKILGAVSGLGKAPGDIRHIVATHAHPDHIGSLAALVRATGAQTWMHPLDAPIAEGKAEIRPVKAAPELLMRLRFIVISRLKYVIEPATIDHTIEDGDVLPGGLTAIHVPGHCAGQVALLWRERGVLLVADACVNMLGLGDPIAFEDEEEGRRSQRKLSNLDFQIACFGHGKALTRDAARRFRQKWG
jgi:glyoxylase-like metal-dependent hydrolase (beta-lactamase superfamily II)